MHDFTVPARGMTLLQIRQEPSDEILVERCRRECCFQFAMFHSFEDIRQIGCHYHCVQGRDLFNSVATSYAGGNRAEVVELCLQK